jgi:Putative transposase
VSAFVSELSRSLRRRAKKLLGLARVTQTHTGAVAAIQRTDSALRLNVHVHVLALDGVYVRERADGPLTFHALPTPSAAQVADVARRTAERLGRAFKAQGRPASHIIIGPGVPSPTLRVQRNSPPGTFLSWFGLGAVVAGTAWRVARMSSRMRPMQSPFTACRPRKEQAQSALRSSLPEEYGL